MEYVQSDTRENSSRTQGCGIEPFGAAIREVECGDRHRGRAEVTGPRRMRPFGGLDAAIMELLWDAERPPLVRDVVNDLHPKRPLAYTTVMTVMESLSQGLVDP